MPEIIDSMLKEARDHAVNKQAQGWRLYQNALEANDLDQQITVRENEIMAEVCAETNGDGIKKLYSNDTERKAQVVLRSIADQKMIDLNEKIRTARADAKRAELERDFAHDSHRAILAAMNAMRAD